MTDWTPDVPSHWRLTTIGEATSTKLGRMLNAEARSGEHQVPYLRNENVRWGGFDLSDIFTMSIPPEKQPTYLLEPGDVLVCEGGEIGRAAVWSGQQSPMYFQKALHRIRVGEDLLPQFLSHWLRHLAENNRLLPYATGSTIAHLPQRALRKLPLVIPPLEEQRVIVDQLEQLLSRLDAAEAYRSTASAKLPLARAVLLRHLVGSPDAELRQLEDVAEILDSQRVPVNATERAKRPGAVPYYGAAGQVGTMDEALFDEPLVLLGEDGIKFDSMTARKAYSVSGPAWVNNHAHVLRPKPVVRQRWLEAALNAADYDGLYSGTTRLKLNQGQMKKLRVPVPSLEVQDAVLAQIDTAMTLLAHAGAVADKLPTRSATLRRSILKVAFEGRLTSPDVQDETSPDDIEEALAS